VEQVVELELAFERLERPPLDPLQRLELGIGCEEGRERSEVE